MTGKDTAAAARSDDELDALLVRNVLSDEVTEALKPDDDGGRYDASWDVPAGCLTERRPQDQRLPDLAIAALGLLGLSAMLLAMLGFLAAGAAIACLSIAALRYGNRAEMTWGVTFAAMATLCAAMAFGNWHAERRFGETRIRDGYRWARAADIKDFRQCPGEVSKEFRDGCAAWVDEALSSEPDGLVKRVQLN